MIAIHHVNQGLNLRKFVPPCFNYDNTVYIPQQIHSVITLNKLKNLFKQLT